jgi:archaellum component FlaD/FlaE
MKLGFTLSLAICAVLLSAPARAQLIKPIDRTKQADVNDKSLSFGDLQFNNLSQPMSDLPGSALSKGDLKLQDTEQKKADLKMLEMHTVTTSSLPSANFTTRRAEADVTSDETKKQSEQTKKEAQIKDRQIKPFTPSGEEELKHQLNEPPLDVQSHH